MKLAAWIVVAVVAVGGSAMIVRPAVARESNGVNVGGVVRDLKGKGIAGVPVHWSVKTSATDLAGSSHTALTDASGRYEIADVKPGLILAVGVDGETRDAEPDLNAVLTVPQDDVRRDFVLDGALAFSGRVDAPVAGPIEVDLTRLDGGVVRSATVQPDGAFSFTALCPDVYVLRIEGEGFQSVAHTVALTRDLNGYEALVRPRGAALSGHVVLPDGADSMVVRLCSLGPAGELTSPDQLADGSEGDFAFGDVAPGRYRVDLRVPRGDPDDPRFNLGYTAVAFVEMPTPPRRVEMSAIELVPNAEVGLLVTLPKGAPRTEGSVAVDSRSTLTQRFFVVADEAGAMRAFPVLGFCAPMRTHRDDGSLLIFGVAKGKHRLHVELLGYEPLDREIDVAGAMTVEVVMRRLPGRLVRAEIYGTHAVDVRVAGANAPWRPLLWFKTQPEDCPTPEGGLAFLAPGRYEFRATSETHPVAMFGPTDVKDLPSEPLKIEFAFAKGFSAHGTLLTRPGGRRAERWLHVFRADGLNWTMLPERDVYALDATFSIEGLTPGRYRIALAEDGALSVDGALPTGTALPVAEFEVEDADVTVTALLQR